MRKGIVMIAVLGCLLLAGCSEPYVILNGKLSVAGDDNISNWITPSKIIVSKIGNDILIIPVELFNDREEDTVFEIGIRTPDFVEIGYESLSSESLVWANVAQSLISIPAKSTRTFQVMVGRVDGSKLWDNTETWVSVKESLKKTYNVELILRVLVKGNKGR